MIEYIIVGDVSKYGECLIYVCGRSKEHAEGVLDRMLNRPTYKDKRFLADHKNIRVEEVEERDCWWNKPLD